MAMGSSADGQSRKAHRSRHSSASAKKKTKAKNKDQNSDQKHLLFIPMRKRSDCNRVPLRKNNVGFIFLLSIALIASCLHLWSCCRAPLS
ncbi:hypothetical protein J1N35_000351 [Gossypium stocksii]|uniref:Uncharacterized protein n=1 Tax=Gossypium stocksii TaxID=47602 RepID=A0A9D4AKQ3_9ROSI|nr:hypothetical protein J1N35_000351 [Gossypium stocksii]